MEVVDVLEPANSSSSILCTEKHLYLTFSAEKTAENTVQHRGGGGGLRVANHRGRNNTKWGDGGGGHWLARMEWHPAGWSVCLLLLIFRCTIKSRSSLLAPPHPGGPGKRVVKRLWW